MKEKLKNIFSNKLFLYCIFAYFSSVIILTLIYLVNGMIFGEYIIMRSDFLHGYIPILKDTARTILKGDNIFFSFESCLGLNNIFYLANIVFSPFNVLYIILFNVDENIVTLIVILLKIGCVAASFQIFSYKVLNNKKFSSVIFSVFYALCAYTLAYGSIIIMWFDAMMILPLLIWAILRCINENKRLLLIFLYFYLFISQFYIAYMVGIFTLIFTLAYLLIFKLKEDDKFNIKKTINSFFNWVLCVVNAVLLSAFVWVPTLFFILGNRAEDSTEIIEIPESLIQIVNSFFWGMGYNISGTFGYVYCGLLSFLGILLFFEASKIKLKEKIFGAILLGIMLLSMSLTSVNLFWHVFDQPDFFWYRYSFIVSFIACAVASRYFAVTERFEAKKIWINVGVLALFYLLMQQTADIWNLDSLLDPSLNDNNGFAINLAFLMSWTLIAYLFYRFKERRKVEILVCVLSLVLAGVEIVSCSPRLISALQPKEEYYRWYSFMDKNTKEILDNDNGLYRVVVTNNIANNSDTWFGYNGITDFGDQEKMKVRHFLSDVGFATSPRYIDDTGYTPVSNMLLGVKYNLIRPYETVDFEENEDIGEGYYLQNDYALNIGYMINGEIFFDEGLSRNVFENMNTILLEMTGIDKECFVQVPNDKIIYDSRGIIIDQETNVIKREAPEGSLYITVLASEEYKDAYLQFEHEEASNRVDDYYIVGARNVGEYETIPYSLSTANRMYYNQEKERYHLVLQAFDGISPDESSFDALNIYYFDDNALKEHYEYLSKSQLDVKEWHNGYISGNVSVSDQRRLLFTSIPYDPGWSVFVNGVESEITTVLDGAFVGVLLPSEGDYSIEFKYEVPGLKIGSTTSLLGILLIFAVAFEKKLKKKDKKEVNE